MVASFTVVPLTFKLIVPADGYFDGAENFKPLPLTELENKLTYTLNGGDLSRL